MLPRPLLLLGLGVVLSLAVAALQRVGDVLRAVAAVPAAAAVVAAMFQLLRDQVAHDRDVSLQSAQNSFAYRHPAVRGQLSDQAFRTKNLEG